MRIHRVRDLLLAAVLVAGIAPAASGSIAAAASPSVFSGPAAYVPLRGTTQGLVGFDKLFTNLDYNGGPLMASNTDYIVFWSPRGIGAYGPGAPPQYTTGLQQYFTDLAHDNGGHQNVDSIATQYNDLTGASARYAVTFGGTVLDTDPYPASQCPVNGPAWPA